MFGQLLYYDRKPIGQLRELLNAVASLYPLVRGQLPVHCAVGHHQTLVVIAALLKANPDGCKAQDNDGNTPLHIAIEFEAAEETVQYLLDKYIGACREFNALRKLPYDLALEHNLSGMLLEQLTKADKEARDNEVGVLAWLWG